MVDIPQAPVTRFELYRLSYASSKLCISLVGRLLYDAGAALCWLAGGAYNV